MYNKITLNFITFINIMPKLEKYILYYTINFFKYLIFKHFKIELSLKYDDLTSLYLYSNRKYQSNPGFFTRYFIFTQDKLYQIF